MIIFNIFNSGYLDNDILKLVAKIFTINKSLALNTDLIA